MTCLVEIFFFPKESVSGRLKLTQGAVCQSVILSVSRCSPPSHPRPLLSFKNTTPLWIGGYLQPLISSHWPCSRITAKHWAKDLISTAMTEYVLGVLSSNHNQLCTVCVFCFYGLSPLPAAVFRLYAGRESGKKDVLLRLYLYPKPAICLCLTAHPHYAGYIWKNSFQFGLRIFFERTSDMQLEHTSFSHVNSICLLFNWISVVVAGHSECELSYQTSKHYLSFKGVIALLHTIVLSVRPSSLLPL